MRPLSRLSLLVLTLLLSSRWSLAEQGAMGVAVTRVPVTSSGSLALTSSTRLDVTWTRPDRAHHVEVVVRDSVQGSEVRIAVAAAATQVTLVALKAATPYVVTAFACANATCTAADPSESVEATIYTEYWQLVGEGHSVDFLGWRPS